MSRVVNLYLDAATRRNNVLGEGIVDLARATARSVGSLYGFMRTQRRERAWIGNLDGLNDHLLRDIGLARHEISDHVGRHVVGTAASSEGPRLVRRAGRAVRASRRGLQVWRNVRVTARQLRRIDDRLLSDIGLQAGKIDWFARDLALGSLATTAAANDDRERTAA